MSVSDLLVDLFRDKQVRIPDGSVLRLTDDESILVIETPETDICIEGLGVPHKDSGTHGGWLTVNRMLISAWIKPLILEHPSIFSQVNYHRYPECKCIGCGCARKRGIDPLTSDTPV